MMPSEIALNYFLPAIAFAMGACIGSFLNVVIYRLPLGMRVNEPARSFCPHCKKKIPGWLNIPLFSWLMLRGKCKWCQKEIDIRYFVVELLTAICFLSIWKLFFLELGILGVVALWTLAALLIAATFIDFDHMIIPDSITLGGLGAGLVFSALAPGLHGEKSWVFGLLSSAIGAAVGFALLWTVVMLGKLVFGQIRHHFEQPVDFEISQPGGEDSSILIRLGPDVQYEWGEVFFRSWDRLDMEVTGLKFDGDPREVREAFRVVEDGFYIDGAKTPLEKVKKVTGQCRRATVPREAMGFGDIKFMAMIGAFQGWQAVLVTLMAACCIGAVIGSIQKWFSKENKIPFGPYLALGSFIFMFTGAALLSWYFGLM